MTLSKSEINSDPPIINQGLPVHDGNIKIYPKTMAGSFRTFKWLMASLWLAFFLGPYLRWDERQAILLDIPARQFHFFGLNIYPEDVWLLAVVMLIFAMLLILVTVIAGRVFCGYFCFQTVWSDLYLWIEERFEGRVNERQQLDQDSWGVRKIAIKLGKHLVWLLLAALTGVSFAAWFTEAYQLWIDLFTLQADESAWVVLGILTVSTCLFAGVMREQTCFWLCPYARIQGVMYGDQTILPTYDLKRGEPRAQLGDPYSRSESGDCVDCDLCVAVCPTGIDIRDGQQIGCITCGLCIDACDHVMDRIDRPKGLVGYKSLISLTSGQEKALYKKPLVVTTFAIIAFSLVVLVVGIQSIGDLYLNVYHQRQPLFIELSSGEIRNRYQVKIENKTDRFVRYQLTTQGFGDVKALGEHYFTVAGGASITRMVVLDLPRAALPVEITPITFLLEDEVGATVMHKTVFIGPEISIEGEAG